MNAYIHHIPATQIREIIDALPESLLITGHIKTLRVTVDGELLQPSQSHRIIDHSREFAWGYAGSGPAQLALAILLKYLPKEIAVNLHQEFKINVVSGWPQGSFGLRIDLKEEIEKILNGE